MSLRAIVGLLALGVCGFVLMRVRSVAPTINPQEMRLVIEEGITLRQNQDKYLVVFYTDSGCVECKKIQKENLFEKVMSDISADVVVHHYPLIENKNSANAAIVAQCIQRIKGDQEAFAYMQGLSQQSTLSKEKIIQAAEDSGVKQKELMKCLDHTTMETINRHSDIAFDVFGVDDVPSIVLINKKKRTFKMINAKKSYEDIYGDIIDFM